MRTFRRVLFWCHLCGGAAAGLVILAMSVTGVLLTYQRQMQWWADTRHYRMTPSPEAPRVKSEVLFAAVDALDIGTPTALTVRSDPAAPAAVTAGTKTIYVNPYTGVVYGEGTGAGLRAFFAEVVSWHRYMAFEGESRPIGKGITGAANLVFLFIVLSGVYLWWPRSVTRSSLRNVTWFRSGLTPKARDFNWHNVFGFWSAVPLAIVVFGAVVISYPWATNLVYRAMGDTPPPPAAARPASTAPMRADSPANWDIVDAAIARVAEGEPAWTILTVRLPASAGAPVTVTVDRGDGGQPQLRSTATLDASTMVVSRWERFEDQSAGRRARSFLRFAHTGEYAGLTGQTVAGLVSAAAAVLVYSGLALSIRRFFAWRARRTTKVLVGERAA
jgi:uncharacterized iron-regulated membrane protein